MTDDGNGDRFADGGWAPASQPEPALPPPERPSAERSLIDRGVDADEVDDDGRRGTSTRWWALAAVVAVAGAVGLVIARPWSGDDSGAPDGSSVPTVVRPDVLEPAAPELSDHLIIGDVPEEMAVEWVSESIGDQMDSSSSTATQVVMTAGTTMAEGPWLSASVQQLDRSERNSFDPSIYLSSGEGDDLTINDADGMYTDNGFIGDAELAFGPVGDGFVVTLTASGVDKAQLLSVATEMVLDDSPGNGVAWPLFGDAVARLGLRPLVSYAVPGFGIGFAGGGPMMAFFGSGPFSTSVSYSSKDDSAGDNLSVSNDVVPAGLDPLTLARFVLTDAAEATVHDQPAVWGTFDQFLGATVVTWVEGGRLVTVALSGSFDDPVAVAESVRVADDDEWAQLLEESGANQDFGGSPEQTWLIGVGELEDATTWVVEGAVDEDGMFTICTNVVDASFGSSTSCSTSPAADDPAVVDGGFLAGNDDSANAYVATVPLTVTGATLRFTADDGTIREAPLHTVREDWPFAAAAVAITSDGRVEIIASDGTVLAGQEVSFVDFGVDGGFVEFSPDTTVSG